MFNAGIQDMVAGSAQERARFTACRCRGACLCPWRRLSPRCRGTAPMPAQPAPVYGMAPPGARAPRHHAQTPCGTLWTEQHQYHPFQPLHVVGADSRLSASVTVCGVRGWCRVCAGDASIWAAARDGAAARHGAGARALPNRAPRGPRPQHFRSASPPLPFVVAARLVVIAAEL